MLKHKILEPLWDLSKCKAKQESRNYTVARTEDLQGQ